MVKISLAAVRPFAGYRRTVFALGTTLVALCCFVAWFVGMHGPLHGESLLLDIPAKPQESTQSTSHRKVREVRDDFWIQGLSHFAFHRMKGEFAAALLRKSPTNKPRTAVIIGVEYGGDVLDLARMGYNVLGFEPNPQFVKYTRDRVAHEPRLNATIFEFGVAGKPGQANINYQDQGLITAEVVQIDQKIREHVDLLSLDAHTNHFDILVGATNLINTYGIDVMWIEVEACTEWNAKMFHWLSENYELFDFVWWGSHHTPPYNWKELEFGQQSFGPETRPDTIDEYLASMCRFKQDEGFFFLQTDIVAVKRSLVDDDLLSAVASMHEHCRKKKNKRACPLRQIRGFDRR